LSLSSDTNHFIDKGEFEDELKKILKIKSDYQYQSLILQYSLLCINIRLLCAYKKQLLCIERRNKNKIINRQIKVF